jgi:hypothetical protein
LAERGLRTRPRPRVPRPGFHYGHGPEYLLGGGYPSFSHIRRIVASGSVPLLKLHGSVSWSLSGGQIARYHDCRPAIRGDALIVAPVAGKRVPAYLVPTWELARDALHSAGAVITVGYSLPEYDHLVLELLRETNAHAEFHLFDPDPAARSRYERLLHRHVEGHPGLPAALPGLAHILDDWLDGGRPSASA